MPNDLFLHVYVMICDSPDGELCLHTHNVIRTSSDSNPCVGYFEHLGRAEFTQQVCIQRNNDGPPSSLGPETSHENAWYTLPVGTAAFVKVAPLERPVNTGRFMRIRVTLRTLDGDTW